MLEQARKALRARADPIKAKTHRGFFKDSGGDQFLGERALPRFLDRHAAKRPRTMLRYAIERLPLEKRQEMLGKKAGA